MNLRLVLLALLPFGLAFAAEEPAKTSARERLRARIAEDAKKTEPRKTPAPAATATETAESPIVMPRVTEASNAKASPGKSNATAAGEKPTVLPKVEVKKGRITDLDVKLAKQEQDIAREQKNLKSSELDNALNDSKIAKPLSLFGGDSTQFRKGVASERVELMEAEKDIIEAIAHAKTKEEKASLQKQLDELRTMRRQLDQSLR